jgi:hypothetical protein
VAADRGGVDVCVRADINEVGDAEGEVGEGLGLRGLGPDGDVNISVCGRRSGMGCGEASGRVQGAVRRDEDVAAEMDGDGFGGFVFVFGVCGGGGGGGGSRGG